MTFSLGPASFIRGPKSASPSNTRGGSRVPEWGPLGSVRGALSNERPYRDLGNVVANYPVESDVAPNFYPTVIGVWGSVMPCWAVMAAVRGAEPSLERSAADRRTAA